MYLTPAKMAELFGPEEILHLTNLYDPDATAPDNSRTSSAIDWAASIINSYLSTLYSLPLSTTPVALESCAADLARYQLDSIRPRQDVRQRYEDAIKWLESVAAGKIGLGPGISAKTTESPSPIGGPVEFVVNSWILAGESLSGY